MNLFLEWIYFELLYLAALDSADQDAPTVYSSRIDGALLPWGAE